MKKRIVSLLLTLAMCTTMLVTSGAATNTIDTGDYQRYAIDFTQELKSSSLRVNNTVDDAILFVKSLSLTGTQNEYVETACLAELELYKEAGIELDAYTVLVPKGTSAEQKLGTYNNMTFYYTTTSEAKYRKEIEKVLKTSENDLNWDNFAKLGVDILMCFAAWQYSIPYTVITSALSGDPGYVIKANTFMRYVYQIAPETRTIYAYQNGNKKISYIDQKCTFDTFANFCPVGTGFSKSDYLVASLTGEKAEVNNYSKTNTVLQTAYTYFNRNAQYVDSMNNYDLGQRWGK
ncbi:MAG: hypothetical protein EOM52_05080 [Clostridia bacterium]|nr:hypothetical protein [Clostridia bacterium]